MKICLANTSGFYKYLKDVINEADYLLESFYYFQDWQKPLIHSTKLFLVDSGAYSFMANKKTRKNDYEEYLEKYINFINTNNVKYFFNLDLDTIIGIDKTKKLTEKLEKNTGKQSIPVFHKILGLDYYKKIIQEYKYIAIGTIFEYNQNQDVLEYLINLATKYNCKVHGLGYTRLKNLPKLKFFSVDSTTWNVGNRCGQIYKFNGNTIETILRENKQRIKDHKTLAIHNFREWVKLQKYAERSFL